MTGKQRCQIALTTCRGQDHDKTLYTRTINGWLRPETASRFCVWCFPRNGASRHEILDEHCLCTSRHYYLLSPSLSSIKSCHCGHDSLPWISSVVTSGAIVKTCSERVLQYRGLAVDYQIQRCISHFLDKPLSVSIQNFRRPRRVARSSIRHHSQ